MHPEMERIQNCLAAVRRHTDFVPEVAVVLGSGLGGFADMVKQTAVVPYSEIPGFPVSTAPGHAGRFVFGYVEETPVVVMQGRVHLYEGYTPHDVVLPVRLMKAMGAKILFVTNASGGIRGDLTAGTLMSITDHISALIPNPLIGANIDELGVRFPDMSNAYDKGLRAILRETAKKDDLSNTITLTVHIFALEGLKGEDLVEGLKVSAVTNGIAAMSSPPIMQAVALLPYTE